MKQWIRRRTPAIAGLAALVSVSLLASTAVVSNASWNDTEWVHSGTEPIGTLNCTEPGDTLSAEGTGRILSGSLLGIDLDSLVEVSKVNAHAAQGVMSYSPAGARQVEGVKNGWHNPLELKVVNGAVVTDLSGLLQLPTNNDAGLLGQYGQASADGKTAGAAGYLTNNGGISLSYDSPSEPPSGKLATLNLSRLISEINEPLAQTLSSVTNVELTAGAVDGRARLDGCAALWANDIADALTREYLATSLSLDFESTAVKDLKEGITGALKGTQQTVEALAGDTGLINRLQVGVLNLVSGLIKGLGLGAISINDLKIQLDLAPVLALLDQQVSDQNGIVTINLANSSLSVNLAALITHASPPLHLNNQLPNTNILKQDLGRVLESAILQAVSSLLGNVADALQKQLDNVGVSLKLVIVRTGLLGFTLSTTVNGNLSDIRSGKGIVVDSGGLVGNLLATLGLDALPNLLLGGLGPVVANAVTDTIALYDLPRKLRENPDIGNLTNSLNATVALVYTKLFLDGVVAVTVNAQNHPNSGSPGPPDWEALPAGQFDVAAIRVGVLDAAGTGRVAVYLGRGSVGPVCVAGGRCAGVP